MEYKPITGVWEITMGCNMRCKHCGSSCNKPLADELTTDEALKLCDDLGEMGFEWLTLSGGEPTTRNDWHKIAKRLNEHKIIPNMITNGWTLDEDIIEKAIEAGINTLAISIDGLEPVHDFIRKEGSFGRIMAALDLLQQQKQIAVAAITTVNSKNIEQLEDLKAILIAKGVRAWQVQIGLPMGNMAEHQSMIIEPSYVDRIIDFAYDTNKEGKIEVQPADCIGYYSTKEIEARQIGMKIDVYRWQGCPAGKNSIGILHNGDITGCTSIRDRRYIAGNIKERPIREIWDDPESFAWNRRFTREQLTGFCQVCQYAGICLGGCTNTRLTMGGDITSENRYCSYHVAVDKAKAVLAKVPDSEIPVKVYKFIENKSYQLAEILLTRALAANPSDIELLNHYGFVNFMLGNYAKARQINQKVLELEPGNVYALKGLGLSLARMGEVDSGINLLRQAVALASEDFMDPYYDLAVILLENGRHDEAAAVLEAGCQKSQSFAEKSRPLYQEIKGKGGERNDG